MGAKRGEWRRREVTEPCFVVAGENGSPALCVVFGVPLFGRGSTVMKTGCSDDDDE